MTSCPRTSESVSAPPGCRSAKNTSGTAGEGSVGGVLVDRVASREHAPAEDDQDRGTPRPTHAPIVPEGLRLRRITLLRGWVNRGRMIGDRGPSREGAS